MALILPDFQGRKCLELDLCGHLPASERREGETVPEVEEYRISQYTKSGIDVYVGLVLPFPTEEFHVHLRLATAAKIGDDPPETNATTDEVLRLVEPFLGRKMLVGVDGLYRVPQGEVSPIIRSMFGEAVAGSVQIRVTAGKL